MRLGSTQARRRGTSKNELKDNNALRRKISEGVQPKDWLSARNFVEAVRPGFLYVHDVLVLAIVLKRSP